MQTKHTSRHAQPQVTEWHSIEQYKNVRTCKRCHSPNRNLYPRAHGKYIYKFYAERHTAGDLQPVEEFPIFCFKTTLVKHTPPLPSLSRGCAPVDFSFHSFTPQPCKNRQHENRTYKNDVATLPCLPFHPLTAQQIPTSKSLPQGHVKTPWLTEEPRFRPRITEEKYYQNNAINIVDYTIRYQSKIQRCRRRKIKKKIKAEQLEGTFVPRHEES